MYRGSLVLATLCALVAVAIQISPQVHADEQVPNPNCPVGSSCMESYFQGHNQTMNEYMSSPRTFGSQVGSVDNPQQATDYCRNELANANPRPAYPRSFLGVATTRSWRTGRIRVKSRN